MRQPFEITVGEVRRHSGTQSEVQLAGMLTGIALSSAWVPDDAEIRFDGTLEAQGETVVIQGSIRAPWMGECTRCLGPTGGDMEVEFREVFEPDPVEGETFPLQGELIDLAPVVRQALALGLPLAPLCTGECAGPDPEDHPIGGADEDASLASPGDPRWAVLDQLRLDR